MPTDLLRRDLRRRSRRRWRPTRTCGTVAPSHRGPGDSDERCHAGCPGAGRRPRSPRAARRRRGRRRARQSPACGARDAGAGAGRVVGGRAAGRHPVAGQPAGGRGPGDLQPRLAVAAPPGAGVGPAAPCRRRVRARPGRDELDADRRADLAGRSKVACPERGSCRRARRWTCGVVPRCRSSATSGAGERGGRPRRAAGCACATTSRRPSFALGDTAVAEATSVSRREPSASAASSSSCGPSRGEGRAADAMAAGAAFRRALVEETGLDPGPALAALEQEIAKDEHRDGSRRPAAVRVLRPRPLARPSGPFVGRRQDREEILRLSPTTGW